MTAREETRKRHLERLLLAHDDARQLTQNGAEALGDGHR
jgi:hypothetical protein